MNFKAFSVFLPHQILLICIIFFPKCHLQQRHFPCLLRCRLRKGYIFRFLGNSCDHYTLHKGICGKLIKYVYEQYILWTRKDKKERKRYISRAKNTILDLKFLSVFSFSSVFHIKVL